MFNNVFVLSLLICAAAAELSEGLYRILNPEINTLPVGSVATAGYELWTPVELSPSESNNLYELWVVRRIPQSPPNFYTIQNIGQHQQPSYAVDRDFTFREQNQPEDAEIFVFTDTNPQPYYITSPDNNDIYVIYTSRDRTRAWTAQVDYLFDAENCIHRAH